MNKNPPETKTQASQPGKPEEQRLGQASGVRHVTTLQEKPAGLFDQDEVEEEKSSSRQQVLDLALGEAEELSSPELLPIPAGGTSARM